MESKALTVGVVGGLFLIVCLCLWKITAGTATATEALLLSVILTLCSVVASWVGSKHYADYSYDKNLRIFALKAAEKVTNLSDELVRLSGFLQQELESEEYESPKEAVLAKNDRMEAAIHMINTLKSVNDRSLSDWQGVIGDEIKEQRAEQEEREEMISGLLTRLESLPVPHSSPDEIDGNPRTEELRQDLESIRKEVRVLASQVSGVPIRLRTPTVPREHISHPCPVCSTTLNYRQRAKEGSTKVVKCHICDTKLFSRFSRGEFKLFERKVTPEQVRCPSCDRTVTLLIDPVVGTGENRCCPNCEVPLRATRTNTGVQVRTIDALPAGSASFDSGLDLSEVMEKVRAALPEQPWPKGTARRVAAVLGLPFHEVSEAIQEMIRIGQFKMQVDGQLYEPVSKNDSQV
ncbi:MAG: hypothetical protein ABSC64_12275 [Candidatus Korobacteraceae bacterium]|jgi:hypothetical protein